MGVFIKNINSAIKGTDLNGFRFFLLSSLIILLLVMLSITFLRQDFCLSFKGDTVEYFLNFEKGRFKMDVEKVEVASLKEKIDALTLYNKDLRQEQFELFCEKTQISMELEEANQQLDDFVNRVVVDLEQNRTYFCDLDDDGINELIGFFYLYKRNKYKDCEGIQVSVYSRSSPRERQKEVFSFMFKGLIEEPVFEDLDNDGKKEMIVSAYDGNSSYGRTVIFYGDNGNFKTFDSKKIGKHCLRVSTDKKGVKKFLTAWPCYRNRLFSNSEQICIPIIYKWNGSSVVKASDEERNQYYKDRILPKLRNELTQLPNPRFKNDEDFQRYFTRRIYYLNDAIKVIDDIMNGKIKDEAAFLEEHHI